MHINKFKILLYSLLCIVILPASRFALLGMEKGKQKEESFKLISTDNIEHTVSRASLAVSKTLTEMVQEPFLIVANQYQ